jgi:hypothetical protein
VKDTDFPAGASHLQKIFQGDRFKVEGEDIPGGLRGLALTHVWIGVYLSRLSGNSGLSQTQIPQAYGQILTLLFL